MILVVDNRSSFIDDLLSCMDRLNVRYEVRRYDEIHSYDSIGSYDAVILSGRKSNDRAMNVVNMRIVRHAYMHDIPLLGICYGLEITALAFNGSIVKNGKVTGMNHVHVKCNTPIVDKGVIEVYESHEYSIARLPRGFVSIACSNTCSNEVVMHKSKDIFGTQFHPEVSGMHGFEMIKRFCYKVGKKVLL